MQIKDLGLVDYQSTVNAMQSFTLERDAETEDELWLLEHHPVFTQGANGDPSHILMDSTIPIVTTDRGGQVTYHGPGQLVVYTLVDIRRAKMGVRQMVTHLEQTVTNILAHYDIDAYARPDAPGVYVDEQKIASLGLRVKRGACYHGLSLNIDMDLVPFSYINPCGYAGMEVIDMTSLGIDISMSEAKQQFVSAFQQQTQLGINA
ncbi:MULTISPECIES: lipoyl(octanoyl) transferase LipB [unclassified Methylophaga]|jgi:lipoyl(octanoyl) transferase|uniref:lipoyl(octanoyl) transferase LipB n=1 Tax=unclassified Methylophaga TaxID=2629249 RepID=UPI00259CF02E|nr:MULTISPECIES: lipoyl(octanoyl) transferase LipB [unclassified Methylophaga]|tara:strand:- start:8098 stop:8712 length:615 start_codon:yes stop_codon:yes gene_type:complete